MVTGIRCVLASSESPKSWDPSWLEREREKERGSWGCSGNVCLRKAAWRGSMEATFPDRCLNSKRAVIADPGPPLPDCVSPALRGRGAGSQAEAEPCVEPWTAAAGQLRAMVRNTCPRAT